MPIAVCGASIGVFRARAAATLPATTQSPGEETMGAATIISGAKAIVIHADLLLGVENSIPKNVPVFAVETPPEIISAYGLSAADAKLPAGARNWDTWLAQFPPIEAGPAEPPGSMIHTSGTTGHPKGVRRAPPTAKQAVAWAGIIGKVMGFNATHGDPQDMVTVVTGPMYHSAPNAYGLYAFRVGANIILQPRFDAEELLQMIERHKVTHLHKVPKKVEFRSDLPREDSGKIFKRKLREPYWEGAGRPI
ncbi:MAG: AMP-binding protein [Parvibaculum sp.]|nr:AMP-binding protein [Parvibaculum sp.]